MEKRKRLSLKVAICIFAITIATISVGLSGFLLQGLTRKKVYDTTIQKNSYIAQFLANDLELYLSTAKETVETAGIFSSQAHGDMNEIENEIFRIHDNFSYFDLMFFMDSNAKIQFSKPENKNITNINTYEYRDYFLNVKENKSSYVSNLFLSTILNEPHFLVTVPVFIEGKWKGLIGGGIPIKNIQEIIKKNQRDFDGDVLIADRTGAVVIDTQSSDLGGVYNLKEPNITVDGENFEYTQLIKNGKSFIGERMVDEELYHVSGKFLPLTGWLVMIQQKDSSIAAEANLYGSQISANLLTVLLISATFALVFSYSLTRPIGKLVEDVNVVDGDNYLIVGNKGDTYREVQELRIAFMDMGERISKKISDVETANDEIQALRLKLSDIMNNLSSGIVVYNNENKVDFVNQRIVEITGIDSRNILGKDVSLFFDSCKINRAIISQGNFVSPEGVLQQEIEIINCRGDIIPINFYIKPLENNLGDRDGTMCVIRDLSDVKALEEEVMREDRVRLLGELSASIIHDIGNPLAGISNLLEVLKANKISEDERVEAFDIIGTEVKDLNKMVRNFLNYTKKKGVEKEEVNVGELLMEVVGIFKLEVKKRNISIVSKVDEVENQSLFINRVEIKQAFINLIKNAIYAVNNRGTVWVVGRKIDGEIRIVISDDGTGIKNENIDRVFNPFFSTKEDGTGLGLPIVYKSIKANGGHISIRSVEGEGTNLVITFLAEDKGRDYSESTDCR